MKKVVIQKISKFFLLTFFFYNYLFLSALNYTNMVAFRPTKLLKMICYPETILSYSYSCPYQYNVFSI